MTNLDKLATEMMGALLVAQGESIKTGERYEDKLDAILHSKWLQIVSLLRRPRGDYATNLVLARRLLQELTEEIERHVTEGLDQVGFTARRSVRDSFRNVIPAELKENRIVTRFVEAERPRRLKKRRIEELSENEIFRIVRSGHYGARMRKWSSRLLRADNVARILAEGLARGQDVNEIAQSILPFVRDYVAAAKRILRTETSRVHNQILERSFEQYRDLIVGFQIIAILDDRTRPHHATRHGKIWYTYKAPRAEDRPDLPDEPNCRCTYTPLLRTGSKGHGTPLPSTRLYSSWFDRQTITTKKRIVGRARYAAVQSKISRPSWNDFINPSTGKLIHTSTLERKSAAAIKRTREQLNSRQKKQAELARGFR